MAPGILSAPHRSPERYKITDFHLPVLVYRTCLPSNPTAPGVSSFLEPNRWVQDADSNTANLLETPHQCLAVLKGYNRLLLGKEQLQPGTNREPITAGTAALTVDLYERDVLVLPAGMLHHSVSSRGNYEHVVFYPKESQHLNKAMTEQSQVAHVRQALLPECDPIFGVGGPLVGIWKEAEEAWLKMAGL